MFMLFTVRFDIFQLWHLDGTDDSEVFHNVILMLVYRVKVLLETGESESVDRYN